MSGTIRKLVAAMSVAAFGLLGVACDDAPRNSDKIDEDDRRPGPGDGVDEIGPFR